VDTNIIIEAFRAHCWNAVTTHFTVETVETCYEEAMTGDPLRPDYIAVDAAQFRNGLRKRHAIVREQRAQLVVRLAYKEGLDAGEIDLFAHALGRSDAWIASCADRAAVYAALELGWEDRFVSLEAIYFSIFIQMTVNRATESIEEVSEDVEEIQEEVEEISEDVEDISEDVEEVQEDVKEIGEDVEEISKDVDKIQEDAVLDDRIDEKQNQVLENIEVQLQKLLRDIETLKK